MQIHTCLFTILTEQRQRKSMITIVCVRLKEVFKKFIYFIDIYQILYWISLFLGCCDLCDSNLWPLWKASLGWILILPFSHHSADAALLVSNIKCICLHITQMLKEIKECEFRALGIFKKLAGHLNLIRGKVFRRVFSIFFPKSLIQGQSTLLSVHRFNTVFFYSVAYCSEP